MNVVVVGAGIGGLTTGLLLHRAGIGCRIYEQSGQLRELGVGINVLPHAVRVLAELGLLDALDTVAVRTAELTYAHRLGPAIVRRPCGLDAGFSLPQLSLHRGRLQGVLLDAVRSRLGPDAVRTGHRVVGFEPDPNVYGRCSPTVPSLPPATCWSPRTASTRRCGLCSSPARDRPGGTGCRCGAGRPNGRSSAVAVP